jgi:hypothetical protein
MAFSRQRVVGALSVAIVAAAACDGGTAETAVRPPFGPESLTVTLTRTPETLPSGGGSVTVRAVARNRTSRPVVARKLCPAGGLIVRTVDAQGRVLAQLPVACRAILSEGTDTVAPHDSLTTGVQGFGVMAPPGTYRVVAVYEAANGHSAAAELPLVIP